MFLRHQASLLDPGRREQLSREFVRRCGHLQLSAPEEAVKPLLQERHQSGIYLWTARPGPVHDDEHVVYIGRTNSLARRIAEYRRGFQAHSVNDYKLRVFQEEVHKCRPSACFALYFRLQPTELLAAAEADAIQRFDPVLNARLAPGQEAQAKFRQAFEEYYAAGVRSHLPEA